MTPRHRAPRSTQARRAERQGVLALPFLIAFLNRFAVRTDNVLLAIGLAVGSGIETWWHDRRKSRRAARQDHGSAAYDAVREFR